MVIQKSKRMRRKEQEEVKARLEVFDTFQFDPTAIKPTVRKPNVRKPRR